MPSPDDWGSFCFPLLPSAIPPPSHPPSIPPALRSSRTFSAVGHRKPPSRLEKDTLPGLRTVQLQWRVPGWGAPLTQEPARTSISESSADPREQVTDPAVQAKLWVDASLPRLIRSALAVQSHASATDVHAADEERHGRHRTPALLSRPGFAGSAQEAAQSTSPPPNELELEYVHGYRGHDCRNNLGFTRDGELVYHAAALGVLLDRGANTQRFFKEHTDDVLCVAVHPGGRWIATGAKGKAPKIHVWDSRTDSAFSTCQRKATMEGYHARGVVALSFSRDGTKLASIGLDDDHSLAVYGWDEVTGNSTLLVERSVSKNDVLCVDFNPYGTTEDYLVTCGARNINFWKLNAKGRDTTLEGKAGAYGPNESPQTMYSVAFTNEGTCLTAAGDGCIYVWDALFRKLQRKVQAHKGPATALVVTGGKVMSAGRDGVLKLFDAELRPLPQSIAFGEQLAGSSAYFRRAGKPAVVVALAASHDASAVCLGTATNEVISIEVSSQVTKILVQGHNPGDEWTGELCALAVHGDLGLFVTAGDDKAVCVWHCDERRLVGIRVLDSSAQSADISDDGKLLAVGLDDGTFVVLDMCTLTIIDKEKHRNERVQEIRYSPDGRYLAVGSAENAIDIHDTTRSYKRVGMCEGHSACISHIDWSSDSRMLQSNCNAYAHLYWTMPKGVRVTPSKATIERTDWSTWTCTMADQVKGVFPPGSDGTDVNAIDRSHRRDVSATGDDFGFVKLFRFPCPDKGQQGKEYRGHSSFVQSVRFTSGDRHVVSVGGMDVCTMQWRHTSLPTTHEALVACETVEPFESLGSSAVQSKLRFEESSPLSPPKSTSGATKPLEESQVFPEPLFESEAYGKAAKRARGLGPNLGVGWLSRHSHISTGTAFPELNRPCLHQGLRRCSLSSRKPF